MYIILLQLLHPFLLLFLFLGGVILWLWLKRVESRRRLLWLSIPFAALYLFCTPLVAHLAMATLEWRYPPERPLPDQAGAIVVFGGGIYPPSKTQPKALLASDSLYRCLHAAELYRRQPCKIVVCGGKVDPDQPGPTVAEAMRDFLLQLGIAEEHVVLEDRSRSTRENARYAARLLTEMQADRVILVTEASHLKRSLRSLRAEQIEAFPSGCQYRTAEFKWSLFQFLPDSDAVYSNQRAFHEWLGMAWYWLRGWI